MNSSGVDGSEYWEGKYYDYDEL